MTNEEMLKNCLCSMDRIFDKLCACDCSNDDEFTKLKDFILAERDTLSKSCCSNVVNLCNQTQEQAPATPNCTETPQTAA